MYKELDRRIIAAIERNKTPLYDREVRQESDRIADATGRDAFRVIDGRLQAMRRQKRIQWLAKAPDGCRGWRVVATEELSTCTRRATR